MMAAISSAPNSARAKAALTHVPPHRWKSQANPVQFGGEKPSLSTRARNIMSTFALIAMYIGLPIASTAGYFATTHSTQAKVRQTFAKSTQSLLKLKDLSQSEPPTDGGEEYHALLQKKSAALLQQVENSIAQFKNKPQQEVLAEMNLSPVEIEATMQTTLQAVDSQDWEKAEELYMQWANQVLSKHVGPEELAVRKADAKAFFKAVDRNRTIEDVMWFAMIGSLSIAGAGFAIAGSGVLLLSLVGSFVR